MRAPVPSEPNYTFPTYQVPQVSAMRGSAPPVQVARTSRAVGAEPPHVSHRVPDVSVPTVIPGSSCPAGNSNLRMQSVTDNCLLNSVTVPKIQRNVAHNNSDKLACKSGALLLLGQDIPGNQKADKILPGLTTTQYLDHHDDTMATTTTTASATTGACGKRNATGAYYTFEQLVLLSKWTRSLQGAAVRLPAMRLLGGGESSINTGTSGWGTPPSQQASNNNANTSSGWGTANPANQNNAGTQQWNNNSNRPPNSGPGNTNQDANKANSNLATNGQPQNGSQGSSGWGPNPKTQQQQQQPPQAGPVGGGGVGVGGGGGGGGVVGVVNNPATSNANTSNQSNGAPPVGVGGPAPGNSTKQQLEQLSNMREAIFSQDGWGGQYVNQDTNWDIPDYPEPAIKMDGAASSGPPWKPTVNNGTDLWEANLRNGGQPPPQPQQKTPWGHTPSTNIGGTWGEDDDVSDSSSVWTGGPTGPPQNWGGNAGANNASGNSAPHLWGGAKKEIEWNASTGGGGGSGGGGGWGDPRAPDPRGAPPMDHRDIRPDPREMRAGSNDQMRLVDPQQIRLPIGDMRGDLRGITGRLNGSGAETFWPQGGPQAPAHHMHHQGKIPVGPGGNGGAGWEEPSPPSQRRNMPNYDDGTSLWGNPQAGSHWKDLPTGGGGAGAMPRGAVNVNGPPGMAPNARPGMKPPMSGDGGGGVWRSNGTSWGEEQGGPAGGGGGGGWGEEGVGPWAKPKAMGGGGGSGGLWSENDMDWSHKQGPKQPISKDMIWASKQFRMLLDLGFKKEDAENALRSRDMSMEEAVELLNSTRIDWPRRHDDHYDHQQQFAGQRGGFPSGPSAGFNIPPGSGSANLINNMGTNSGTNNSLFNNMSPAVVQKMLSQVGGGSQGFGSCNSGSGGGRAMTMASNPSTAQLRMLVQQIQMAVQAGYLNHQILNQPLAPQTLVLLNQLLQQIKQLQQLSNQQSIAQNQCIGSKCTTTMVQNIAVYITKTKQQITNLQNQIASQQANYVKQQQQPPMRGDSDLFKTNSMPDAITLQANFNDLSIKDTPTQQQSRLTQWKLPNIDKEESSDFSLAPGSARKPIVPSHSSPNLNPLGLSQSNGPWSSGRGRGDSGWPDSTPGENNDIKDAQWPSDLVPEFEPGKPWKGNQKSIEDDPSITPGSVVRSPLLPVLKDELFNIPSKSPPVGENAIQPSTFSLSSSTWSYTSSPSSVFTSPQNKVPATKGVLGDLTPTTAANSGLWGTPKNGPPPPPPGLPSKGGNAAVNGWASGIDSSAGWSQTQRSTNWCNSPWLLLRNLTAQIDGSTLKTLCIQHGPLDGFHLYLHQGFALAKYRSNEEAAKAQHALNNCVLGNTTILAENPTDWEANSLLQQVVSNPGGSGGGWRGSGKQSQQPQQQPQQQPPPQQSHTDMWGTGWSNTQSGSLWPSTPLDSAEQSRGTPSNLQSYLPGDLLGGESI